jgi:hypothetical protein
MKKLFAIIFLLSISLAMFAQSTSPKFGTLKNQDNTGRILNYKLVALTDATGNDSIAVKPNAYTTIYKIAMKDSLTLKAPVVTYCNLGDKIEIILTSTTGTPFLKFYGTNWVTAGKATMSSGLRGVINLVFDGAKWVEENRYIQ